MAYMTITDEAGRVLEQEGGMSLESFLERVGAAIELPEIMEFWGDCVESLARYSSVSFLSGSREYALSL